MVYLSGTLLFIMRAIKLSRAASGSFGRLKCVTVQIPHIGCIKWSIFIAKWVNDRTLDNLESYKLDIVVIMNKPKFDQQECTTCCKSWVLHLISYKYEKIGVNKKHICKWHPTHPTVKSYQMFRLLKSDSTWWLFQLLIPEVIAVSSVQ